MSAPRHLLFLLETISHLFYFTTPAPRFQCHQVEFEPFEEFPVDHVDGSSSDDEGGSSDDNDDDQPVPDPFADVNNAPEQASRPTFRESSKASPSAPPARVAGERIKRGKFESDEDWLQRLEEELENATEERRAAAKETRAASSYKLKTAEEALSVFDRDARAVSRYTDQFLAQEAADEKIALAKLRNRWFGPKMDDFHNSQLNLSGKALERDDLDALAWILRRNWGIRTLNLSRCAIDDDEVHRLLGALRLNTVITRLDLRRTRLSVRTASL